MSAYQEQYQAGGQQQYLSGLGQPPKKPAMLTAALAVSALTALLVIISQVLSLATGRDVIKDSLTDALGASTADLAGQLFKAELDDAYSTLQSRAILGIIGAALVLLFTFLARRASVGPRVTLTVVLLITAGLTVVSVRDVFPSAGKAMGGAAIALAVVAIVLLFLPPVSEYDRARKSAPRA
jgi:FtsH-binding integral membrane protein